MKIDDILSSDSIGRDDIITLLSAKEQKDVDSIFAVAREKRNERFGKKIFSYGFVYFSTYCKNNCTFCYYRRSNGTERYRKSTEEIVDLSLDLRESGLNLVDLTMGEDPKMYTNDHEELLNLVRTVNEAVKMPIMISPGAVPEHIFTELKNAGADWFACYQETHNRSLFSKLRVEQDFDFRLNQKKWARSAGMLTEDGMMIGVGESVEDRADSIIAMNGLGCEQIRAMTFVPQCGAPLTETGSDNVKDELLAIAVMRILYPDKLIPASLDVEGIAGLKTRMNAGANVITSIVPPRVHLAGVAQHELDIDNGNRSIDHVAEMLDHMGSEMATRNEYTSLIEKMKAHIGGC